MHVFLSHSAADRKLAEGLRDELTRDGLSVWTDGQVKAGSNRQQAIEEAIRSADDILILVGSRNDDAFQRLSWRAALEAAWQDSNKRLIPILLRDAALPPFVYGDASGDETRVVRILDPRDLSNAARAVRMALQRNGQARPGRKGRDEDDFKGSSVEVSTKGSQSYAVDGERSDRLLELKKFAEALRK